MNNTAKSKRLDKIDLQLTPKQWAIRLADEIRQYPSQEDFMKGNRERHFSTITIQSAILLPGTTG